MSSELFFADILIVMLVATVVIFVSSRLKIPHILGLLLTGVLAGPSVLNIVRGTESVEALAELGVILLLFTIGVEFSLSELWKLKSFAVLGGISQIFFTFAGGFIVSVFIGLSLKAAALIGFMISLSSTAIVLKVLQDEKELESPHGRFVLAVLIFQDLVSIPAMLFIPMVSGEEGEIVFAVILLLVKLLALGALLFLGARWIIPYIMERVVKTRNQELFLYTTAVLCLAVAYFTWWLKLSPALGAFMAGLTISESEYSHEALSSVLPFKELFTGLFFISIGLLLDVQFLLSHLFILLVLTGFVITLKVLTGAFSVKIFGYPFSTLIMGGVALTPIGEFSFILAMEGFAYGILDREIYQFFLATSILTMASSPLALSFCRKALYSYSRSGAEKQHKPSGGPGENRELSQNTLSGQHNDTKEATDHVIIVGYGVNGQNIAEACRKCNIPFVIIEMNPATVKKEKSAGTPIIFGDAANSEVLKRAGITNARVVAVGINNAQATRKVVSVVRGLNPLVHIITRTQYMAEIKPLFDAGADEVIPEEFEASIEMFSRVLVRYTIPLEKILTLADDARATGYYSAGFLPSVRPSSRTSYDIKEYLSSFYLDMLIVLPESGLAGYSLKDLDLRRKYNITVVAVRRAKKILPNPPPGFVIEEGDTLYFIGERAAIIKLEKELASRRSNFLTRIFDTTGRTSRQGENAGNKEDTEINKLE